MNSGSLRLRLLLAGAVSVLAALALSYLGLTLLFQRHVERRIEAELGIYLDQLVSGLERGGDGALTVARAPADPRFAEPLSGLYWQVRLGEAALRSRSLWDAELALPPDELPDGSVHRHDIVGPDGSDLLAIERGILLPERLGGGSASAAVALDSGEVAGATAAFATDLAPYLALIALLLIAAGYAQVAVGLRPLRAVRERLAAIRQGGRRRLGKSFPDEILPLTMEVDGLLEAREAQLERARARAGDLAHGFKTPLQVLAGDVQRLRAKGETAIADQIEQVATAMRRHVDRELARARLAAGRPNARARIAEVVHRVVGVVSRTPDGARLEWSVDIPADAIARIDPDDLSEALGNLAENAARHARAKVSIRTVRNPERLSITIADDGPGIPEEKLGEALSRGGRLDQSGSRTGLGLAIVSDIADAWGAHFSIRTSACGLVAEFAIASN